jgi:hypothetical protein
MVRSKSRFAIIVFILFVVLLFSLIHYVSAGTPINLGWLDHSFGSSVNNPTAEKPQSKLWFNNGIWWGALYQPSASAFTIHRFNWATDTWTNTGVVIDAREDSHIDTLWDGSKLFIISHGTSSTTLGDSAQVRRYSYNSSSQSYTLDAGFPVTVSTGGMEAAVIAKDSTGILWITFTQNSGYVYVSHSNAAHTTWTTPYVLPFSSQADGQGDDISSIIAFGGNKIGVMWSNQNTDAFYFAVHQDGAADNAWTLETAIQGQDIADDHINLKTDAAGKIYAAVKTSAPSSQPNSALIRLLVRQSNGTWASYNVGRVSDNHTRPMVLIDEATRSIYVFATFPTGSTTQGEIRYKKTSMDSISFPTGTGTQFIYSSSHRYINNVSSSKQNVTCASGVLVIADDNGNNFYFHNKGPCGLGSGVQPSATPPPTATGTAAAPSNRIKDITFENGSLTHLVTGADSVSGTMVLETSNPLKGSYSVRMAPNSASPYLEENFTAANNFYLSFYIKLDAYPTSDVRLVMISNAGTTVGNIQLRPSGRIRMRNGSTTIGAESAVLAIGQLYRIGIQQTNGNGSNAVLRAYLSPNDDAFGSPFAQSTTGTWTTAANRLRLGATTAGTFNLVLDDIRLDTSAMPGANTTANQAPTISDVNDQTTSMNSSTATIVTLGDAETAAESLVLSASSSDQSVVPDANIVVAGSGAERSVTVNPAMNQAGNATITLTVSDGSAKASENFLVIVANAVPTISDISDQTIGINSPTSALAFTIADAETASDNLLMSAASSNPSLIPVTNIVFGGSGANRTVTISPASNQSGTATIGLIVSDGFTTSMDTFILTVMNAIPTISDLTDQTIAANSATPALAFTISDMETAAESLVLSAVSTNQNLVPNTNIVFGGSGLGRTVTLTPNPDQVGTTTIILTVSDGVLSASDSFVLTVVGAGTTTLRFAPTDDALVRSDRPTTNYGSLNYLRLRGTEAFYTSYIKFNLVGVSGLVTSARLRFYATDGTSNASAVYAVSNDYLGTSTAWTQEGLNWNNAPLMNGSPIVIEQGAIANNSWVEYNLSSVIMGDGTYSFGLSIASSNSLYFYSKEAISNQPVLEIVVDGTSSLIAIPTELPEEDGGANIVLPQPTALPTELVTPTEILPTETILPELTSTPIPTIEPTAIPTEATILPHETATDTATELPTEVPTELPTELPTETDS